MYDKYRRKRFPFDLEIIHHLKNYYGEGNTKARYLYETVWKDKKTNRIFFLRWGVPVNYDPNSHDGYYKIDGYGVYEVSFDILQNYVTGKINLWGLMKSSGEKFGCSWLMNVRCERSYGVLEVRGCYKIPSCKFPRGHWVCDEHLPNKTDLMSILYKLESVRDEPSWYREFKRSIRNLKIDLLNNK